MEEQIKNNAIINIKTIVIVLHFIVSIGAPFLMVFVIELISNPTPEKLRILPLLVGIIMCALLEIILCGILPYKSLGLIICYCLAFLFGLTNYFLLETRDIPFMAMDIFSAKTAAAVLELYDVEINKKIIIGAAITLVCIFISFITSVTFKQQIKTWFKKYNYKRSLIIAATSAAITFAFVYFISFSISFDIRMNLWKPGWTYAENSAVTSFITYAQFSAINEPEGYSREKVEEILTDAQIEYDKKYGAKNLNQEPNDKKPTVIAIMDEAFGDLSVLGDIDCVESDLAYYKSLAKDPGTIWHGSAYASTYGGGTARSEYEWLTGYSMKMYANAQPYSQFDFEDIMTFVGNFKEEGYRAIAMHPEAATNYRRDTVYEGMGFEKYYSKSDYYGYKRSDLNPTRVSDSGDFQKIIDEDNSTDEPLFIHNVTMQNHGGYSDDFDKSLAVKVDDEYSYSDELILYESYIKRTDDAIRELVEHYRNSDEPTIICLYGDHLPNLPENFMTDILGKSFDENESNISTLEKRFAVPFFLWANYDIEDEIEPFRLNGKDATSLNYLGVVTRAMAGSQLSAYEKYLLLLREEIPVINESGYYTDNRWHAQDEENEYKELLEDYEIVQYAGMFDSEGLEDFF